MASTASNHTSSKNGPPMAHPTAQVGVVVGNGNLGPEPFEVHRGARPLGQLGQRLVGTAGGDVITGDDGRVLAG
jgi:hypothetical protein